MTKKDERPVTDANKIEKPAESEPEQSVQQPVQPEPQNSQQPNPTPAQAQPVQPQPNTANNQGQQQAQNVLANAVASNTANQQQDIEQQNNDIVQNELNKRQVQPVQPIQPLSNSSQAAQIQQLNNTQLAAQSDLTPQNSDIVQGELNRRQQAQQVQPVALNPSDLSPKPLSPSAVLAVNGQGNVIAAPENKIQPLQLETSRNDLAQPTPTATTPTSEPIKVVQKDKDGNIVKDANGNPVMVDDKYINKGDIATPNGRTPIEIVANANAKSGTKQPLVTETQPVTNLYDLIERLYPQTSEEEKKRIEKANKRNQIFAALGNGLSALSNLYFTTKGAPNQQLTDGVKPLSDEMENMRKKWQDEADKHRDAVLWAYEKQRQYDRQDKEDARADAKLALEIDAADRSERQLQSSLAAAAKQMAALDKEIALKGEKLRKAQRENSPEYIAIAKELANLKVKKEQLGIRALNDDHALKMKKLNEPAGGGGGKGKSGSGKSSGSKETDQDVFVLYGTKGDYLIGGGDMRNAYRRLLHRGLVQSVPKGLKGGEQDEFMMGQVQSYYSNTNDSDHAEDGSTGRFDANGKRRELTSRKNDSNEIDIILGIQ